MARVSGGDRMEAALTALAAKVARPGTLRVGFLEGATYPLGTARAVRARYAKRKAKGVTGAMRGAAGTPAVAMVAAIQEFGAPSRGIPPRPFFRNMVRAKSPEWPAALAALLEASNWDAVRALRLAGEAIAGQLRQSIRDTNSPPLAASTIARKGFSKPLIDTGHLFASVDYEVKE